MNDPISFEEFYNELQNYLPTSNAEKRKEWAHIIVEKDIEISTLTNLVHHEYKITSRFLWLLSDVGILHPKKLYQHLPYLYSLLDNLDEKYKTSLANYWLIAGVPPENKGQAIDLLFQWILSTETNISIKSRAILVALELVKKHPELKQEFILCLNDQEEKHTQDFKKRVRKVLCQLKK